MAIELFASSRLETTERAKFVGMIASLEPLASQERYVSPELDSLLSVFKTQLQSSGLPSELKKAVECRLNDLRQESVSKAIKRLVREVIPDDSSVVKAIDEAYKIRSLILHNGSTDDDLELKGREVEKVIRRLFQGIVTRKYGS